MRSAFDAPCSPSASLPAVPCHVRVRISRTCLCHRRRWSAITLRKIGSDPVGACLLHLCPRTCAFAPASRPCQRRYRQGLGLPCGHPRQVRLAPCGCVSLRCVLPLRAATRSERHPAALFKRKPPPRTRLLGNLAMTPALLRMQDGGELRGEGLLRARVVSGRDRRGGQRGNVRPHPQVGRYCSSATLHRRQAWRGERADVSERLMENGGLYWTNYHER